MRKNNQGFTLIELMISVAIVATLSALAFNSYQRTVLAAGRTDAMVALSDVAQRMQRCFTAQSTYKPTATGVCAVADSAVATAGIISTDGLYKINLVNDTSYTATAYVLTATPVTGKRQAKDTACTSFSLNQIGVKTAKKSTTDNTAECWKR
ncbi:MAG: type IV pilin protein [Pseudomonadota bacterium]